MHWVPETTFRGINVPPKQRTHLTACSILVVAIAIYATRRSVQLRPSNPCLADAIVYLIFVELAVWIHSVLVTWRLQPKGDDATLRRFGLVWYYYFPGMCALIILIAIQAISYCHGTCK